MVSKANALLNPDQGGGTDGSFDIKSATSGIVQAGGFNQLVETLFAMLILCSERLPACFINIIAIIYTSQVCELQSALKLKTIQLYIRIYTHSIFVIFDHFPSIVYLFRIINY